MDGRHLRGLWVLIAGAAVAVALAAALPAVAAAPKAHRAGCGGVQSSYPRHRHGRDRPPLAIGDSTMLLALDRLAAIGYEANAHGCREFGEALALLASRRAAGTLPHMVVIALGADGQVSRADVGRTLGLLCCTHLLVLVTPRELGGGSGQDAAVVREEVARHHNRAVLLDWVRDSAGHGDWFQPDGIHLTTAGAIAFTHLLARALPYAYPPVTWKHSRSGDAEFPSYWSHRAGGDPPVRATRASVVTRASAVTRASGATLRLRTSLKHVGYVGVTISGPAGAQVKLSERHAGREQPLATITLTAKPAQLPHALTWRCDRPDRDLIARTVPTTTPTPVPVSIPALSATATVRTPSCAHRLGIRIDPRARVGHHLTIRLHDRWSLGGLRLRICLSPPGARAACRPWWLRAGHAGRIIHLATPRPGGWDVRIRDAYGGSGRRLVWVEHASGRIRMYAAGDSEMQILDDFLRADLAPRGVGVREDARISTGLTKPFFFDWQAQARAQARSFQPDVSVVFMGANDGFSSPGAHGQILCCAYPWSTGYARLTAQMMRSLLRGSAGRVYWFTLPAPVPGQYSGLFSAVNAGIRQAAREFRGRVSLIDANAFFTPGNRYRDFMTYHGHGFTIHESDGAHLSIAADAVATQLVINRMRADHVIR